MPPVRCMHGQIKSRRNMEFNLFIDMLAPKKYIDYSNYQKTHYLDYIDDIVLSFTNQN
jgi:hypothetical protein